ncbi:MAG: cellulase family glycosylhydrolase [Pseudomonadales bacterium]|nr:cellulase family glycosylhydrolase [Pseudomonadales bacterium]MCP5190262.1 cellulase family glycosylhydrolase [Pseudomonadales bacterium]
MKQTSIRSLWRHLLLSVAMLFCLLDMQTARASILGRLDQQGRWLVDGSGRVVMLRGGNLTLPEPGGRPGHPNAETPLKLAEKGFNGVRLVVFFDRLMPKPGAVDENYLEEIGKAVADYRDAGVYVLLDIHQDEYGPAVGVRGLPAWATFPGGHEPLRLPFPAGYFSDPAIQVAFDNFWRNHPVPGTGKGVQDMYIQGAAALAAYFRGEPAVFGIDLMNEPFPGSRCNQPDPASADCPELEKELLAPFYRSAGEAIAGVAPHTIVFVEPFMLQGALGIPMATPPPGAPAKRGLSYHQYGTLVEIRTRGNRYAMESATATGSAILNTEWGFTNDPAAWTAQAEEFDALLVPWLAWARGPFGPLIDERMPAAGNDNREATLRALARPYPRATAGTPLTLAFDGDRGVLEYRYSTKPVPGAELRSDITEIVMPAPNFPSGYKVIIPGGGAVVVSEPDADVLVLRANEAAKEINVQVTRIGTLPALPPPVATANSYAHLAGSGDGKHVEEGELTTESMVGDLLADPRARAILAREIPDLVNSPQIGMGSQMTLRELQRYAPEMLTPQVLDRIDRQLADSVPQPDPPTE